MDRNYEVELNQLKNRAEVLKQKKAAAEALKQAAKEQLDQLIEEAKAEGVEDVKKLPQLIEEAEKQLVVAKAAVEEKLIKAEAVVLEYEQGG